jgi:V/A-type H+-transporting ATPase subunit I
MKRFYLAVPLNYEDAVLTSIGELGTSQLTREIPIARSEVGEEIEVCRKFIGVYDRIKILLRDFSGEKRSVRIQNGSKEVDFSQIRSLVDQTESDLNEKSRQIETLEAEIKALKADKEKLGFLKTCGLEVSDLGNFRHIFVKAGFLNNLLLLKFGAYVNGTSVVYTSKPGRPRESFVVITGLNEDQALVETILKTLNFEELTFPKNLDSKPENALEQVKNALESREKEIQNLKTELEKLKERFDSFSGYVNYTLQIEEAKSLVTRTKSRSLIHGWIPSEKTERFTTQIENVVPKENVSLKFEDPNPSDKVPVALKSKGLLGAFGLFTYLQGVPSYFEIDPTLIYLILYASMFGMMFGDIGDGALLILIGFLLTRARKRLLAFSATSLQKIGMILVTCGVSTIFFGFLYGEAFVTELFKPLLFSPLHDITGIVTIALIFGVLQLTLALSISIINSIRRKDVLTAVFSGRGIVGLSFYLSGVVVAIAFIRELNLGVFVMQDVLPFTSIAVFSLALVLFSPAIKTLVGERKGRLSEKLIEGFGEGLETFITSLANSVSYIRLAAFAIAHGALGMASVILASMTGNVPSLILINVIVFVVDGFAALIQSLRLMYYEFSTKFYVGNGVQFRPFMIVTHEKNT